MQMEALPHLVDVRPFRGYHCAAPSEQLRKSLSFQEQQQQHQYQQQQQQQQLQFVAQEFDAAAGVSVLQAGEPLLNKAVAEEVPMDEIGSARIERVINDMVIAMRSLGGCGLAAPQIGEPLQIIVLEDSRSLSKGKPFELTVIINPKLKVLNSGETETCYEECLSVSGYCALVKRYSEVEVTGLNRRGDNVKLHATGWMARLLQHECDHLDGVLYVDKMVPRSFRSVPS